MTLPTRRSKVLSADAWPYVATMLQLTAVGVALVACVLALREPIAAEVRHV